MARIILDFGSANTHKNNWDYLKRMHDELKGVDSGHHEVIIKHQLFRQAGDNIPLERKIFEAAYIYAEQLGYKTTSSVFDKESLDFLLQFDVPFVKIANRRELDWLIGEVPRKVPVYVSRNTGRPFVTDDNIYQLACISKYPCEAKDYLYIWAKGELRYISDHTTDFKLWYDCQPQIIEWHYGLLDSTGLDAGPFMRTPEMLAEIL